MTWGDENVKRIQAAMFDTAQGRGCHHRDPEEPDDDALCFTCWAERMAEAGVFAVPEGYEIECLRPVDSGTT